MQGTFIPWNTTQQQKETLIYNNLDASQRHCNKQKKLITKGHKLYDLIYVTFSR